tara:strand:+ start:793 stop:2241 length:1449 start_codon:yes stop_codon:yes gene_type:complete
MTHPIVPIILSGGTGARLWPVSRESHPKPFITLPDGQSLLQKTFIRACQFSQASEIITITNREYFLKSKAEYETAGAATTPPQTFLLEPFARNTASAIALAALKVAKQYGPDAIMLVLPADHLITPIEAFTEECELAFKLAADDHLVTFGVQPTTPETGYGYIECEHTPAAGHAAAHQAKRFVEKPTLALAEQYLIAGDFLWNAGIFCFKAGTILKQFSEHAPTLYEAAITCWHASLARNENNIAIELDENTFSQLDNISIDYAVMEKADNIMVIRCHFDWQDIGSWEAYQKLYTADQDGNTVLGDVVMIDSQNNFIHSQGRMVASIGISNLAIIDTPDAMLITHRDRTQDVKKIVQTLKNNAHESYATHRTTIRPWGSYTVLEEGSSFKIKRIVVQAGASLSLQKHHHRSEHWVVVEGTANIIIGDEQHVLQTNESTFVPKETPHRLSNLTTKPLVIIEVQTGSYLGEDDIVRFEDTYGRA